MQTVLQKLNRKMKRNKHTELPPGRLAVGDLDYRYLLEEPYCAGFLAKMYGNNRQSCAVCI